MHYPDLATWFQAPLTERVGLVHGDGAARDQLTCSICHRARRYLLYLVVRGSIRLDWEWLIAVPRLETEALFRDAGVRLGLHELMAEAIALGYTPNRARLALTWAVLRICLHTGTLEISSILEADIVALEDALYAFEQRTDVARFYGSFARYLARRHRYLGFVSMLRRVLYHRGQIARAPRRGPAPGAPRLVTRPDMQVVIDRYLGVRRLQSAPKTVTGIARGLRYFVEWLAGANPQVVSLAEIRREHVAAFAEALQTQKSTRTGLPLVATSRRGILAPVAAFFQDTATWGWEGVPDHPLLMTGDFPRLPEHVPRFIPEDELARLMAAVRLLPCPYQRAALLIARWSGARRGEIRRLAVDCLDHYPDRERTWRLRIPAGKTYRERLVPLHDEAAEAIQAIQQLDPGARGFPDEKTGLETRYLFVRRGEQLSASYLFEDSLRAACQMAGLTAPDGRATITAHRFRHTVGTRLAESGARLQTIMKVLGHVSPQMALVYANISDREVLKDYAAVLGPGATIAGPMAATLRAGDLPAASVEWLKTNFLKTELELGHCLRLPEEGPCECDLYLSCAKFVTSREYAPRLRARRQRELMLVNDAVSRGWDREVERHRCTVQRLEQLLAELNEPLESPDSFE